MSDGGWYGYPPQEPDPYAQAQDDWNRPPLDYSNPPQDPGYPSYGQSGQQSAAQYYDYPQQQQQPQPQQPPQQPRGPRPQQPPQDPRYRQQRPPQSQNPYVQPGQPGYPSGGYETGGYDTGGYAAPRQQYGSTGQQPRVDYEGYPQQGRQSGYDTGSYGSGAYETGGYGTQSAQTQSFSSGAYPGAPGAPAAPGAGTGSRRARPGPAESYPDPRDSRDPYADPREPRDPRVAADPRDRGARDPYGGLAEDSDAYEYPGRGGRRRAESESGGFGAAEERDGGERIGLLTPEDSGGDGDSGGRRGGGFEDKPERKRKSCLAVFVAFGILAGILGGGGFYGYKYYESHYGPPADFSSSTGIAATVVVTIPDNSGGTAIGALLYQDDVVKSQRAFTKACEANPKCGNIQANTYLLHKEMSAAAAVSALLDTTNVYNKSQLLVRPGERASDVFLDLEQKTGWTQAQILSAIGSGKVDLPSWANAKTGKNFPFADVEGLLFTGTYQLPSYKDPTSLIKTMIDKQVAMFDAVGLSTKAKAAGGANLTPYQVLIIASMARAEAGTDTADLGKISGVIYHRLKDTADFAHLGFDTTTLYGMGESTTTPDNKDTTNPYNTSVYGIKGLPPGPIDSIDQTTLEAALNPTDSTDLYFCAVDGSVFYAADSTGWAALGKAHPGLCGN